MPAIPRNRRRFRFRSLSSLSPTVGRKGLGQDRDVTYKRKPQLRKAVLLRPARYAVARTTARSPTRAHLGRLCSGSSVASLKLLDGWLS